MSENELRPCPFCGNEPQEITLNGKPLVVCWGRGCVNDPENWNTRPIEDALNARIAELESTIERLIEAGKRLLDSLCIDPEEEKTVEVMNWKAVVDKVNKERER